MVVYALLRSVDMHGEPRHNLIGGQSNDNLLVLDLQESITARSLDCQSGLMKCGNTIIQRHACMQLQSNVECQKIEIFIRLN